MVICRALREQEPAVDTEVAATKAAWSLIVHGLPTDLGPARASIHAAAVRAGELRPPAIFDEAQAASATGPGSSIIGTFRSFAILAARGWAQIDAAGQQLEHGSQVAAAFARANAALYIESVYDAHFGLGQIGKHLLVAYKQLGGARTFGASLAPAEVQQLAGVYSEVSDQLYPRATVKLGS